MKRKPINRYIRYGGYKNEEGRTPRSRKGWEQVGPRPIGAGHERGSSTYTPKGHVSELDFFLFLSFSFPFLSFIGLTKKNSDRYANSKELQFGLLSPQDIVKLAEFEVTHRDLYTYPDRHPSQNGVLDRRLVSFRVTLRLFLQHSLKNNRAPQTKEHFARHVV